MCQLDTLFSHILRFWLIHLSPIVSPSVMRSLKINAAIHSDLLYFFMMCALHSKGFI